MLKQRENRFWERKCLQYLNYERNRTLGIRDGDERFVGLLMEARRNFADSDFQSASSILRGHRFFFAEGIDFMRVKEAFLQRKKYQRKNNRQALAERERPRGESGCFSQKNNKQLI